MKRKNKRTNKPHKGKVDERREFTKRNSAYHEDERVIQKDPFNDFSWYNANPLLTQAAASIPYPYRPGMLLDYGPTTQTFRIPGVLRINWVPTVGQSSTATDPASIAAKEVYATVRDAFSGTLEADGPDYIIYFMALDSVFSYIGALKRVFRVLNTYTPMNYNVPDVVLRGMGVNTDLIPVLKRDRMKLFQVINELVGMTRKFKCPAIFPIFNRHYWLNDNVYTDANSANSQMYCFNETSFYKFELQNTPDKVLAGGLTMVTNPLMASSTETVDDLYEDGRSLIDALAAWEDAYTISGYLQRAYSDRPNFSVDEITLDERFEPLYEPAVLPQIENAFAVGQLGLNPWGFNPQTNVITQDPKTNAILCSPSVPVTENTKLVMGMRVPVSIRSDAPTLIDTVEATRLHSYVKADGKIGCGTEIVWSMYLYNYTPAGTISEYQTGSVWIYDKTNTTLAQWDTQSWIESILSAFDWHPIMYRFSMQSNGNALVLPNGDLHNITVIDQTQMDEINKICLYSEFNSFNTL